MDSKFDETTRTVFVQMTRRDGMSYFNIVQPKEQDELTLHEIRMILAGAVALTIKSSDNDAKAMREVIEYLEREFVDVDSFNDHMVKVKQ
jgi:uncharacterized cupredoxin-like copper-binding protein